MTAGRTGAEQADSTGRFWGIALLTETEAGRRNRRTIDSVFLWLVAGIVIGLSAVSRPRLPRMTRTSGGR